MAISKCIFCESKIKAPTQEIERWCVSCRTIRAMLCDWAKVIRETSFLGKKSREHWAKELISLDIEV